MKHKNSLNIRALLVGTAFLVLALRASGETVAPDQGGAGTIDPNSVAAHERLRYTLGDPDELHGARAVATDASGNYYVASILRIPPTSNVPQPPPPRSVLTKFNSAGSGLWSVERKVTSVEIPDPNAPGGFRTTYYEQWSARDQQRLISAREGQTPVNVVAIALDPQGNLVAAFEEGGGQTTLLVKFDPNGNFLWRRATPEQGDFDPGFAAQSLITSLNVSPSDSSIVLLERNFYSGFNGQTQTVIIKLAADGTRVFTSHFGQRDDGSTEFESTPIAVTRDGAGNIYLLSTESPDYFVPSTPDQILNVVRKLSATGALLVRKDVRVFPTYTAGATRYLTETWATGRADEAGNLYIIGSHFRPRSGTYDGPDQGEANQLVLKLKPDLAQAWRSLGPQATGRYVDQSTVAAVEVRVSGHGVTVGGYTTNTGVASSQDDYHWEVARYGLDDGQLIWHRRYQAPEGGDSNQSFTDRLLAMQVDSAGNVYSAGWVSVATGGVRYALIKYSDGGDLQFVKLFPDQYLGVQPVTLSLSAATGRPIFFGGDVLNNKQVIIIDFDNPPVVAAVGALANIATRVRVGSTDNNSLIGGFIVTGAPGTTKKILVRAIGPSLIKAGVSTALPDTTLELRDSNGKVYTNDNWRTPDPGQPGQEAEIIATTVPPSDDRESAIIATVSAGNTTAIVRGKSGAAGIGLVEVYDIDTASAAQVVNISTRGRVETDNDVMIGGVIVFSPNPSRVIVRAMGPSLANAGLQNVLQDPQLELYDGNGTLIVSNDDWKVRDSSQTSQQTEIEETTIPPGDPRESALRATLDPGNYTALVRGKGRTTGLALVEVYRLR